MAACSRKMAAGLGQAKASAQPRRAATWAMIHQSALASPGAGRKARWRLITRSLLVTVPSFSPQPKAGRRMRAACTVSESATQSLAIRLGMRARAVRISAEAGSETAGLVAMTQRAPMRPWAAARNISTALRPGREARWGVFQKRARASASPGASHSRWPASMVASAPVSRPPMALGWPVTLKGPPPGWPRLPCRMWQLMMAFALSAPAVDWLAPWLKRVTVLRVVANHSKKRAVSAGLRPVSPPWACSAASRPGLSLVKPWAWRWRSRALKSATSPPGRMGR